RRFHFLLLNSAFLLLLSARHFSSPTENTAQSPLFRKYVMIQNRIFCRVPGLQLLLALFSLALIPSAHTQSNSSPAVAENPFEKNVRAYEAMDRTNPPPPGAILLVGDSQFFRWKTVSEDLPDYTIVN